MNYILYNPKSKNGKAKEIIENIVTLLSDCPTKKLKKIYEIACNRSYFLL